MKLVRVAVIAAAGLALPRSPVSSSRQVPEVKLRPTPTPAA